MTAILGYHDRQHKTIYIATDSRCTWGSYNYTANQDCKAIQLADGTIYATAGPQAIGQHIKHCFQMPVRKSDAPVMAFLLNEVLFRLTSLAKVLDCKNKQDNNKPAQWAMLLAYENELYQIANGQSLTIPRNNVAFIGSGGPIVGGAFSALLEHQPGAPDLSMVYSLEIAAQYDSAVGPPYHVLKKTYE